MVPHPPLAIAEVGRGQEEGIRATLDAYDKVAADIAAKRPDTIIISSPHSIMYADYFHISPGKRASGDMARFGAPMVSFTADYDDKLALLIENEAAAEGIAAGTMGERDPSLDHGTIVPLYFICKRYTDFKLVRIGLSGLSLAEHYRLGMIIAQEAERLGRRTVFVGSGDLSHKLKKDGPYGLSPEGPVYDERIMKDMGEAAFDRILDYDESFCSKASECGHRSFVMMAGALDGCALKTSRLSHEGPFGVGYGICMYEVIGSDEDRHFLDKKKRSALTRMNKDSLEAKTGDPYVKLAYRSIYSYVRDGVRLEVSEALGDMTQGAETGVMLGERSGVFVSIHKNGQLRGCIGTFLPVTDCIAAEILRNAVSASTEDPRFDPVTADELDELEVNVDVLSTPLPVEDVSKLDAKKYGVIVTRGSRRGLLLPDLPGVDTVDQQIAIAKQKAGIRQNEEVELLAFEVIRHR
ncbi:MAG: AmmeMemoRadiSam system protein A [Lachnospiraceae bacterium]|nr:AmmeMemoRadiSam system protein A [Lachnospiraceae bacterium]